MVLKIHAFKISSVHFLKKVKIHAELKKKEVQEASSKNAIVVNDLNSDFLNKILN